MDFKFYFDTDIDMPHTEKHGLVNRKSMNFLMIVKFMNTNDWMTALCLSENKKVVATYMLFIAKSLTMYILFTAFDLEDPEIINMINEDEA